MTKKIQWVSFHFVAEAVNDNSLIVLKACREEIVKSRHVTWTRAAGILLLLSLPGESPPSTAALSRSTSAGLVR